MSTLPLSIVIPTHNRPELVRRAVASALRAAPAGCEVLVVDDASAPPAGHSLSQLAATDAQLGVVRNAGSRGAAGARNFGVSAARGAVILFLDDDDELVPSYPARVLEAAARGARFGFSAMIGRHRDAGDAVFGQRPYPSGILPARTPLRHRIGGAGAGFWIDRDLFLSVNGFATDQIVDEDTSLFCTLAARSVPVWYEDDPGVIIHRDHGPAGSGTAQLTLSTRAELVAACYLRTWHRHDALFPRWSEARWFLATRYLRRALKSGQRAESWAAVRAARPAGFAAGLALYWAVKAAVQAVRGTR